MTTTTEVLAGQIASDYGGVDLDPSPETYYEVSTAVTSFLLFPTLGIPAGATVTSASLSLASVHTRPGNELMRVLLTASSDPLSVDDYDNLLAGESISLLGTEWVPDEYVRWDATSALQALVALPEWDEGSSVRMQHSRTTSIARRVHAIGSLLGLVPKLEVTWEPGSDPDPEQTYRIVGPAGLENVRLIGVTTEGGITSLRLTGEWNGHGVAPLN